MTETQTFFRLARLNSVDKNVIILLLSFKILEICSNRIRTRIPTYEGRAFNKYKKLYSTAIFFLYFVVSEQ